MVRVHIVAQQALLIDISFHITIMYNIYLPGGGSQAMWMGGWAH